MKSEFITMMHAMNKKDLDDFHHFSFIENIMNGILLSIKTGKNGTKLGGFLKTVRILLLP